MMEAYGRALVLYPNAHPSQPTLLLSAAAPKISITSQARERTFGP